MNKLLNLTHHVLMAVVVMSFVSNTYVFGNVLLYGKDTSVSQNIMNQSSFKKVKEGGWEIPTNKAISPLVEEEKEFQGVTVKTKFFTAKDVPVTHFDIYTIDKSGNLLIRTKQCEVSELTSYEINGKVFGWRAGCVPVVFTKVTSTDEKKTFIGKKYSGTILVALYLDEDGNGDFETRYDTTELQTIPNWVK